MCTDLHDHSASNHMFQCAIVKLVHRLEVEELFIRADGLQQLQNIVGVQSAGLTGHSARQVSVTNMGHTLMRESVRQI